MLQYSIPAISTFNHIVINVYCTCIASGCFLLFCVIRCDPPLLALLRRPWSDLQQHAERQRGNSDWKEEQSRVLSSHAEWRITNSVKVQSLSQLQINKFGYLKSQRIKTWCSERGSWSSSDTLWAALNKWRGGRTIYRATEGARCDEVFISWHVLLEVPDIL